MALVNDAAVRLDDPDEVVGAATPVLPDFGGASLVGVVPGLLDHLADPHRAPLPSWMPASVAGASQIVLLVIDGLGAEQLRQRAHLAPILTGADGGSITSVAPSTTACALTTLVTGRVPAEHGVVGYRVALDGEVFNVLQWSLRGKDARMMVPAHQFQPFASFPGARSPVPVVTRYDYGPTGFTAAHLGAVELHRWHTQAGLVTSVRQLTEAGAPFVYAYYEGIDKSPTPRGSGEFYDDELARSTAWWATCSGCCLPMPHWWSRPTTVRLTWAGRSRSRRRHHGARDAHQRRRAFSLAAPAPGRARGRGGGGPGPVRRHRLGADQGEIIDEGWLGAVPSATVAARLGDLALMPFVPTAFLDPADTGELRLMARHGSLTPAEMYVPLLGWRPS